MNHTIIASKEEKDFLYRLAFLSLTDRLEPQDAATLIDTFLLGYTIPQNLPEEEQRNLDSILSGDKPNFSLVGLTKFRDLILKKSKFGEYRVWNWYSTHTEPKEPESKESLNSYDKAYLISLAKAVERGVLPETIAREWWVRRKHGDAGPIFETPTSHNTVGMDGIKAWFRITKGYPEHFESETHLKHHVGSKHVADNWERISRGIATISDADADADAPEIKEEILSGPMASLLRSLAHQVVTGDTSFANASMALATGVINGKIAEGYSSPTHGTTDANVIRMELALLEDIYLTQGIELTGLGNWEDWTRFNATKYKWNEMAGNPNLSEGGISYLTAITDDVISGTMSLETARKKWGLVFSRKDTPDTNRRVIKPNQESDIVKEKFLTTWMNIVRGRPEAGVSLSYLPYDAKTIQKAREEWKRSFCINPQFEIKMPPKTDEKSKVQESIFNLARLVDVNKLSKYQAGAYLDKILAGVPASIPEVPTTYSGDRAAQAKAWILLMAGRPEIGTYLQEAIEFYGHPQFSLALWDLLTPSDGARLIEHPPSSDNKKRPIEITPKIRKFIRTLVVGCAKDPTRLSVSASHLANVLSGDKGYKLTNEVFELETGKTVTELACAFVGLMNSVHVLFGNNLGMSEEFGAILAQELTAWVGPTVSYHVIKTTGNHSLWPSHEGVFYLTKNEVNLLKNLVIRSLQNRGREPWDLRECADVLNSSENEKEWEFLEDISDYTDAMKFELCLTWIRIIEASSVINPSFHKTEYESHLRQWIGSDKIVQEASILWAEEVFSAKGSYKDAQPRENKNAPRLKNLEFSANILGRQVAAGNLTIKEAAAAWEQDVKEFNDFGKVSPRAYPGIDKTISSVECEKSWIAASQYAKLYPTIGLQNFSLGRDSLGCDIHHLASKRFRNDVRNGKIKGMKWDEGNNEAIADLGHTTEMAIRLSFLLASKDISLDDATEFWRKSVSSSIQLSDLPRPSTGISIEPVRFVEAFMAMSNHAFPERDDGDLPPVNLIGWLGKNSGEICRQAHVLWMTKVKSGEYQKFTWDDKEMRAVPRQSPDIVNVLVSDAKEIALRASVNRIRKAFQQSLTKYLVSKGTSEESISRIIQGDTAHGILSYMTGFTWSMLETETMDPNLREFGDRVAHECRIAGGTDVFNEIINDILAPVLSVAKTPEWGDPVRVSTVEEHSEEIEQVSVGSGASSTRG